MIHHAPLHRILGEKKGIPPLVATQMQRFMGTNTRWNNPRDSKPLCKTVCSGYLVPLQNVMVPSMFMWLTQSTIA